MRHDRERVPEKRRHGEHIVGGHFKHVANPNGLSVNRTSFGRISKFLKANHNFRCKAPADAL